MTTAADLSIIARIKVSHDGEVLSKVMQSIAASGGNVGAIDIQKVEGSTITRDFTIYTNGEEHGHRIVDDLKTLDGIEVVNVSDPTFLMHLGGKIKVESRTPIKSREKLSQAYTPGVARVCLAIAEDESKAHNLTIKHNTVAVVSDGTAVLGLGDIGPSAAMPVMEGKAMLFKDFAGVDAFPICLDTKDPEEIIRTVKYMAPTFGGINLEDISSPRCFEIEDRLKAELDIPVFHDDQHGTAIVMTAGLINALKLTGRKAEDLKVVFSGVGAAGIACTKMLKGIGVKHIIGCDRRGALYVGRDNMDSVKQAYAEITNPDKQTGSLNDVIKGADVFIGLSGPKVLSVEALKTMNPDSMIFAMANPTPEIMPEEAEPYASVIATGRSDYPNQINNVLAFPGIFRGALDCHAKEINEEMKIAAAQAIADVIPADALSPSYIIPSVFDSQVAPAVAKAVMKAAKDTGVARK